MHMFIYIYIYIYKKETKIDERNITDNRAMRNKNRVKREEKKDGSLEKIDLKKMYSQLLEEEPSRSGDRNKSTPPNISTNSSQVKNDSGFFPIIFNTRQRVSISIGGIAECPCLQ